MAKTIKETNVGWKPYTKIVAEAVKAGYDQVFVNEQFPKHTICNACDVEMRKHLPKELLGKPWVRKETALVFHAVEGGMHKPKYRVVHACQCGHRKFIPWRERAAKKEKKPIKITNKCVKKGCNNDLPDGRKSYCYECKAPPKTKQPFKM